jgi:putative redox protein
VTTVRHVARAAGSTGAATPVYRVDIRVSGHDVTSDEPSLAGGGDAGPSPFGLLLSALVACTAMTLRMYAMRKGWELATVEVDARYDVDDDGQSTIARTITVHGDLTPEQRQRLADIAERTPVTLAIRGGTPLATTWTLD